MFPDVFVFIPSHNLQYNPKSMHSIVILLQCLGLVCFECGVRVYLCWEIRHPKFRKVINLPNYIYLDILKEVGFGNLHSMSYILDTTLCLRIGIGQTKLIYYSELELLISIYLVLVLKITKLQILPVLKGGRINTF